MGSRLLEQQDEMRNLALECALAAGAVTECQFHQGTYLDSDDADKKNHAYALATIRAREDGYGELITEIRKAVQSVLEDAGDECYSCEKWAKD